MLSILGLPSDRDNKQPAEGERPAKEREVDMASRLLQGGILAALLLVAGLLFLFAMK